jgi:hypothetical protein
MPCARQAGANQPLYVPEVRSHDRPAVRASGIGVPEISADVQAESVGGFGSTRLWTRSSNWSQNHLADAPDEDALALAGI